MTVTNNSDFSGYELKADYRIISREQLSKLKVKPDVYLSWEYVARKQDDNIDNLIRDYNSLLKLDGVRECLDELTSNHYDHLGYCVSCKMKREHGENCPVTKAKDIMKTLEGVNSERMEK
jgi:hypothetical protein